LQATKKSSLVSFVLLVPPEAKRQISKSASEEKEREGIVEEEDREKGIARETERR